MFGNTVSRGRRRGGERERERERESIHDVVVTNAPFVWCLPPCATLQGAIGRRLFGYATGNSGGSGGSGGSGEGHTGEGGDKHPMYAVAASRGDRSGGGGSDGFSGGGGGGGGIDESLLRKERSLDDSLEEGGIHGGMRGGARGGKGRAAMGGIHDMGPGQALKSLKFWTLVLGCSMTIGGNVMVMNIIR
jgi:hypothetical protein